MSASSAIGTSSSIEGNNAHLEADLPHVLEEGILLGSLGVAEPMSDEEVVDVGRSLGALQLLAIQQLRFELLEALWCQVIQSHAMCDK